MKRKHSIKKIFAVMFAFVIVIGVTACGSNNEQTGEKRGSAGQMEENQPIEESYSIGAEYRGTTDQAKPDLS